MQTYNNYFKILKEKKKLILLLYHLVFETKILGWIENLRINFRVLNYNCANHLTKINLHLVIVTSKFLSSFLNLGVT